MTDRMIEQIEREAEERRINTQRFTEQITETATEINRNNQDAIYDYNLHTGDTVSYLGKVTGKLIIGLCVELEIDETQYSMLFYRSLPDGVKTYRLPISSRLSCLSDMVRVDTLNE